MVREVIFKEFYIMKTELLIKFGEHIKMLRNSLGQYRKFIVTLRGMGYKFEYNEI